MCHMNNNDNRAIHLFCLLNQTFVEIIGYQQTTLEMNGY